MVKGRPLRKKITFFKILLPFKNKNYFTFDNLSKYGHVTLKFVGILSGLLQCFPKNRAILVQKLGAEKLSKFVSGYFMTKKTVLWPLSPRGGGGGKARPLREEFFLRLP